MKSAFHSLWLLACLLAVLLPMACSSADGSDADSDNDEPADDDTQSPDDDSNPVDDDSIDDDTIDDDVVDDDVADDDLSPADWMFIRDDQGRARILRGCNFDGSAKGLSGLPQRTEQEAIDLSQRWGFNFLRYLIFWARIEPEAGVYDEAYLDEVETWLDTLAELGFAVVLDMHQDVWGPYIKDQGQHSDGAPEWATVTDGYPHIPFAEWFGNWGFDYLSPDVMRAFDNFWAYDRHPELQDHYGAMWAHVVARFRDHPAVLGYDIMNEPWQGSGLFSPFEFDQTLYSDFLERMIGAIREEDADSWIFYEPTAFVTNQGLPNWLRVLNDPRDGPPRLAYFPHLYPVLVDLAGGYYPNVDHAIPRWERLRRREMEQQQSPLLCGEWAMLRWLDEENARLWMIETMSMFDRVTSGWAYWDCGFFLDTHGDDYRALVASVYPRAIAGTPTEYRYDVESHEFTLVFDAYEGADGPTEIYLAAEREYPTGWNVESSDPAGTWNWEWDEDTSILSIWSDPNSTIHTIVVKPTD